MSKLSKIEKIIFGDKPSEMSYIEKVFVYTIEGIVISTMWFILSIILALFVATLFK